MFKLLMCLYVCLNMLKCYCKNNTSVDDFIAKSVLHIHCAFVLCYNVTRGMFVCLFLYLMRNDPKLVVSPLVSLHCSGDALGYPILRADSGLVQLLHSWG